MYKFSKKSLDKLKECDTRLQTIFTEVITVFDCAITEGHRGEEAQNRYFAMKLTKVKFPKSKHNSTPAKAVDAVPYVNGKPCYSPKVCYFLAGIVFSTAKKLGVTIRWGGDWDSDFDMNDQTFNDLVHYEIG